MANLDDAFRGQLSPNLIPEIQNGHDQRAYEDRRQDLAAPGALTLTDKVTLLSVDGTDAFTLEDGEEGQIKVVICVAATSTPVGTLTPDSFGNGTSILFNAPGETITLEFRNGNWWIVSVNGATPS